MAIALCNPEIGSWYRDIQHRLFEVVAVDSEDSIEIQYYDGDVAEFDRESWDLLCVSVVSEPGDGLGPYEDESEEDNYSLEGFHTVSWDSVRVEGEN